MKTGHIDREDLLSINEGFIHSKVVEMTADEARELELVAEGNDTLDVLEDALDDVQGNVFGNTGFVAYLIIKIVG